MDTQGEMGKPVEVKNIPFNPDEKGILLLRGFSQREADEIIGELRRWIEKGEPKFFIWTPNLDVSIEFIKTEDIVDIKAEPKQGAKPLVKGSAQTPGNAKRGK